MQRINLGKPYDEYIAKQIELGYFATATEVLRDALRPKMGVGLPKPQKTLLELVQEGEEDIKAGRTVPYDENFWENIKKKGSEKMKSGAKISSHLVP